MFLCKVPYSIEISRVNLKLKRHLYSTAMILLSLVMFNHKMSVMCNKFMTSLIYWQLITKISQMCFSGCIGEVIARAGIPQYNILTESELYHATEMNSNKTEDKESS